MYILVVKNVNILTILIFTKYFAISYFELRLIAAGTNSTLLVSR